MQIHIKYFASLRESLGSGETLTLEAPLTVGQLRDQLIARGEPHAGALARGRALRAALNQTMCAETAELTPGAEVAFFPPVTGG
ncbi:MoaD/ThiS family protein [Sphaerotilus montanus]|uniref:MoaD/ThiS family protein n=1 Tax=Sphaerotilus montanus TaxID=522889 RepID=UPI003FA1B5C3